jgi:hypothetical protein
MQKEIRAKTWFGNSVLWNRMYSARKEKPIVYHLLILCSSEITLDIFRQKQQVATSCEVTSVADGDSIQFNVTSI